MAALSKEDKEALADYFKDKGDLYDPSKEEGQQVSDFSPDLSGEGYAEGGGVFPDLETGPRGELGLDGFAGPALSADTQTARGAMPPRSPVPDLTMTPENLDVKPLLAPQSAPQTLSQAVPTVQNAPEAAPAPSLTPPITPAATATPQAAPTRSGKLSPDEYADLIASLKPDLPTRIGQGLSSAGATFADAIMQGVARAGNPGFAKNILDQRQKQKENLINALREKYEADYKGQEIGLGKERLTEETAQHAAENQNAAARLKEETRAHDLEAGQHGKQLAFEQGKETREATQAEAKSKVEAAQKIVEAYEKSGYSPFAARPSQAEYNAAKSVLKANGGNPGPAALTATNHKTGHQIASMDGGRTWQNAK